MYTSPPQYELSPLFPLHQRGMSPVEATNTHYLPNVQFDLVDKKELAPLDELNEAILAEDKTR